MAKDALYLYSLANKFVYDRLESLVYGCCQTELSQQKLWSLLESLGRMVA